MESRTYLEGSGDTDEVQILLFHSFSCGDKSHVGGFSLSSLYLPCLVHLPKSNKKVLTPQGQMPFILGPQPYLKKKKKKVGKQTSQVTRQGQESLRKLVLTTERAKRQHLLAQAWQ